MRAGLRRQTGDMRLQADPDPHHAISTRRRALPTALIVLACALSCLAPATAEQVDNAAGGGYELVRQAIAGGGITRARSACFDIDSTVAEPVAGNAQGGAYALASGFLADAAGGESLFRSGFESCQP